MFTAGANNDLTPPLHLWLIGHTHLLMSSLNSSDTDDVVSAPYKVKHVDGHYPIGGRFDPARLLYNVRNTPDAIEIRLLGTDAEESSDDLDDEGFRFDLNLQRATRDAINEALADYEIIRLDGRYPFGGEFKRTNIVCDIQADDDRILIRVDDKRHSDFWLQIDIQRTVHEEVTLILDAVQVDDSRAAVEQAASIVDPSRVEKKPSPPSREEPRRSSTSANGTEPLTPYQESVRLQHREMMTNPERWPCHPFLCLTHRNDIDEETGMPRVGLLYDGHPKNVYPINLYDIPRYGGRMTESEMLQRGIAYDNVDAILNDWQVD